MLISFPQWQDPVHLLGNIAINALSAPSGNGQIERTMNAVKDQHTARRLNLGKNKLKKLVYIQNNQKLLTHFETKK